MTQAQIDTLTRELATAKAALVSTQAGIRILGTGITSLEAKIAAQTTAITELQAHAAEGGAALDFTALTAGAADLEQTAGTLKTALDTVVAELPPSEAPAPAQP